MEGQQAASELVIFDCDGVLVDSEPIAIAVLTGMVGELGLVLSEEVAYELFLGVSLPRTCAILRDEYALELRAEHLDVMRARLYSRLRSELVAMPGVLDMLGQLSLPVCVASSSQPERIRLSLSVSGLLARFDPHIFSAAMVSRGKPAPDLFLHAADRMGVDPARCVVVEDSPAGVAAARNAGMGVLAFTGGSHARTRRHAQALLEQGPDLVFDRMDRLCAILSEFRSGEKFR